MRQRQFNALRNDDAFVEATPGGWIVGPLMLGVAAVMLLAKGTGMLRGARLRRLSGHAGFGEQRELAKLRHALLGHAQAHVADVLGPPRTTVSENYRAGATWYYPVGADRRYAMAIRFDRGRARAVEFVPEWT